MKYGIITHYDVHNHGALLQLNGLKQVLMQLGIEAFALQFDKNYDFMGRAMKAKYEVSIKSVGIYVNYIKEKGLSCFLYNYRKQKTLNRFRKVAQLIGPYYTECKDLDGVVLCILVLHRFSLVMPCLQRRCLLMGDASDQQR